MQAQNLPLEDMARAIARQHGHKGAILITVSEDGYHVGVAGLDDREIQDALCVGIHHNIAMVDAQQQA